MNSRNNSTSIEGKEAEDQQDIQVDYESSDSSDTSKTDMDTFDQSSILEHVQNKSKDSVNLDPELENLQKVDIYTQQLPYFNQIKKSGFKEFEEIKRNIAECIILNEIRPGLVHWTNRLIIFIHEYGLFFTKEDHLKLIHLYMSLMINPEIDLPTVDLCFTVLVELLK